MFSKFKSVAGADLSNHWHFNALSHIENQLDNLQSPGEKENAGTPCFKIIKNSRMVSRALSQEWGSF